MGRHTKLTTVYFDPAEDAEDLAAFAERANEPLISNENVLKELKASGSLRFGSE